MSQLARARDTLRNMVRGTTDAPANEPVIRAYFPTASESVANWIKDKVGGTVGDKLGTAAHFVLSNLDPTEYGRSLHNARQSVARARENPTRSNVVNAAIDAGLNMLGLLPGGGSDAVQAVFAPIARTRGRDAARAAETTLVKEAGAQKPAYKAKEAFTGRLNIAEDADVENIIDSIKSFTPRTRQDSEVSPIQRALWERHKAFAAGTGTIMDEVLGSPSINPFLLERVRRNAMLPENLKYRASKPMPALESMVKEHVTTFREMPQVTRMGDLLDYPDLYSLYPDMQDIPVLLSASLPPESFGATRLSPTNPSIIPTVTLNVGRGSTGDNTRQLSTLLHELQHIINNKEIGFNPVSDLVGGPHVYYSDVDEVMARNAALREVLQKQRELPDVSPAYTEDLPRAKQVFRPAYGLPHPIPKRIVYPAAF